MEYWAIIPYTSVGPLVDTMNMAEVIDACGNPMRERETRDGFEMSWRNFVILFWRSKIYEIELFMSGTIPVFHNIEIRGSKKKMSKLFPESRDLGPIRQSIQISDGVRLGYQPGKTSVTSVVVSMTKTVAPRGTFDYIAPPLTTEQAALSARFDEIMAKHPKR